MTHKTIEAAVTWVIVLLAALWWLSPDADAAQVEYVHGLEQIVAACLSDATGKPIKIGDDWFLCGIVPIQ